MPDADTTRRIDGCRDILVGKQNTLEAQLTRRMEAKIKAAMDRAWGGARAG